MGRLWVYSCKEGCLFQMFTSWNDDPWPGFQKETFHSFEVEQGVAVGWLEDDTKSVIQCDDVYNRTHFYLAPNFRNNALHCIAMVEAAWIRLNHGRHLFRCSTFSISRWRFSPGFYASVSFMIPCSIYFSSFFIPQMPPIQIEVHFDLIL